MQEVKCVPKGKRDKGIFSAGAQFGGGGGVEFIVEMIKKGIKDLKDWLGIELKYPQYLSNQTKATIGAVVKDSLADKAGLKAGDTIIETEGIKVREWDELIFILASFQTGSRVKLLVLSGAGKEPQEKFLLIGD